MDPCSEEEGILREWAPLSALLTQIPPKAQRGLFTGDLSLTCIAALPEHLAIGTNHGLVYWYNRVTNELQRLRCENTACAITCIAVTSTVDFMIAAGTSIGVVSVFLVPKPSPDNIPDVFKTNSKKQIERYTVADLHSVPISAVEWSTNGMKLFSGDLNGIVVLTEIDFYMHLSKSVEIINEKYEVVQLSYNPSNQLLLVSTLYRTILCHKNTSNGIWEVSQVGSKERKILGRFGAVFNHNPENPRFPIAYCSRPGLRLWSANKDGVVEKTLMFKDSVLGQHPHIQLLNQTKSRRRESRSEPHLGPLLVFKGGLLVTYTPEALLILDPLSISVVASLYDVQKISALCVTKSEIFLLEGERHLIRIGFHPEDIQTSTIPDDGASALSEAFANQFLELTAKIKESSITSVIPIKKLSPIFSPTKSSGSSDGEQVSECIEAEELPPVISLDSLHPAGNSLPHLKLCEPLVMSVPSEKEVLTRAQRSGIASQGSLSLHSELLDKIAQEQFEEVVFHSKKKIKKNRSRRGITPAGTESGSDTTSVVSATSENDEVWSSERLDGSSEWSNVSVSTSRRSSLDTQIKPEIYGIHPAISPGKEIRVVKDTAMEEALGDKDGSPEQMQATTDIDPIHKPEPLSCTGAFRFDRLSKDQIEEALATKERLLAKKYNLEAELGLTQEENDSTNSLNNDEVVTQRCAVENKLSVLSEDSAVDIVSAQEGFRSNIDDGSSPQEETMPSFSSSFNYGPPSGSSQQTSRQSSLELELSDVKEENVNAEVQKEAMEASGWLQFSAPKPTVSISVSSHYLVAIDTYDTVHYCALGGLGLKWQRADCKASQIALSPNLDCVWRLYENVAYALKNPASSGPHGDDWLEAAANISCIAVSENTAWLVTQDGDIFCQKGLDRHTPVSESTKIEKPCEWPAVKIVCYSQIVWLLSTMGEVYMRLGVSSARPEGADWKRVNIPIPGSIVDISLGSQRTGWIVDNNDTIMFSVDHMENDPHWWQVLISDYVFQHTSPLQRLRSKLTKNLHPALSGRQSRISTVVSSKESVWILRLNTNVLHANKTKITGHSWTRIKLKGSPLSIKWQTVSAESIFENGGQIWLLSANGDLFCSNPYNNRNLKQIQLPTHEGVVCLAASSQSLWVLTPTGKIFIRQGLSETCFEGKNWIELSLTQIEDVHLTHVSCGLDVVWACDTGGNMHMTVSFPHAMATAAFSPVWIHVPENKEQKKIFFIKVFVGPQTYMVWALDDQGKVYVREAIFPDFPLGADWVAVTGITAVDLSVSSTAVWALSVDGDVYRRQGITQNNYIGDYWKKIPGSVEALTASMCDRLWGIDKSGSLLRHTQLTVSMNPGNGTPVLSQPLDVFSTGVEGDWEVL